MVTHQNTFTLAGRGQRLAVWEGELIPGDLVSFTDASALPGYSLHLHVSEEAFFSTRQENRLSASLEGHEVVLTLAELRTNYPVDQWFCSNRYLMRYCSAISVETMLEFTVSLVIDGKSWIDFDLGMKREGFQGWLDYDGGRLPADGSGPRMAPGPWGKLEWWVRERPCLMASSGGSGLSIA